MTKSCMVLLSLLSLFIGTAAHATPQVDHDRGTWSDTFADKSGIAVSAALTFGVQHDALAELVKLLGTSPGQVATVPIAPASFERWGKVYLAYSAVVQADLELRFLGDDGVTYGPFALMPSDDPAWQAMAALDGTVPATVATGRVLVTLRSRTVTGAQGPIQVSPRLEAVRATWTPRALVRVAQEPTASPCAEDTFVQKVRVAVSLVNATDLVVWAPLPTAAADPFGQPNALELVSATHGGTLVTVPTPLNGETIPARSVVWHLGAVKSGNTLQMTYSVRAPKGTTDGTVYTSLARARAANSLLATAPLATTTVRSAPEPYLRKSSLGTFLIYEEQHIEAGERLGYQLDVGNFWIPPGRCTEAYHDAVVWDDVSDLLPAAAGAFTIEGDGELTTEPIVVDGVAVPANSIYWRLGTLAVGARTRLRYAFDLRPGAQLADGTALDNVAHIMSAAHDEADVHAARVIIGIPDTPSGAYAKGDRIRGAGGISAGHNDAEDLSVGYREPITYLLLAENRGASELNDTLLVDKVPDGTTLSAVFLPAAAGGTIHYYVGGRARAPDDPPGVDVVSGGFVSGWTTQRPADLATVGWVAFRVPRLASAYFPDDGGVPSAVVAELTVVTTPPADGCPARTIENVGLFNSYAYTPVGDDQPIVRDDVVAWASDLEPTQVKPTVPSFERAFMTVSPGAVTSARDIVYTLVLPNTQTGGVETDTALDVAATIELPVTSLNGVATPLSFVSLDAPGGTLDLGGLPARVTVRYPAIAPQATRTIALAVHLPAGYVSGATLGASARVTAQDDVCGQVTASAVGIASAVGDPYLQVSKRVDLGVAAPGSELTYTLSWINVGDTVSTGTWVVDRIPEATRFVAAEAPPGGGTVWFSAAAPPTLPALLRDPDFAWSDQLIRESGLFVQGTVQPGGAIVPPGGPMDPTYVAFHVDEVALMPPQLPVGAGASVRMRVAVDDDPGEGDIAIPNAGLVVTNELLPAISNEVRTLVALDPSLEVTRACPDVVAAGETFSYTVAYVNNSSNADHRVRVVEALPSGVALVARRHDWNAAAVAAHGNPAVPATLESGALTWAPTKAFAADESVPLGSLEGGVVTVTLRADAALASGTLLALSGTGRASDAAGDDELTVFTECRVRVENADLRAAKAVDQPAPVAGETVTFALVVSNRGGRAADAVSVVDTLPAELAYVPGTTFVATPGWGFAGTSDPVVEAAAGGASTLRWDVGNGNALRFGNGTAGRLPGRSGDVTLLFQARVKDGVGQAVGFDNVVDVATTTGEDATHPNHASVHLATPRPNVYVDKAAPALALPGQSLAYRVRYGNASRQATGPLVIVDRLFDYPLPSPDGAADVTYLGHVATHGEQVWFHDGALDGAPPAFGDDPAADGWRDDPAALDEVRWIAIARDDLAGSAGPFDVFVDVALRRPSDGALVPAGAAIDNTVVATLRAGEDEDGSDNASTAITRTPGVDVALALACDPSGVYPGVLPGDEVGLTLTLVNSGTVSAYGLRLVHALPAWFEKFSDDAGDAVVLSAAGAPTRAIDRAGRPLSRPLAWVADGDAWTLGEPAAGAGWYGDVGLAPGSRARLTLRGRVRADLGDGTPIVHEASVATDTSDRPEEIQDNNAAACGTVVVRPDPLVVKTMADAVKGAVAAGERVRYTIAYNNVGSAPAADVTLEDYLPEGAGLVLGSFEDLPADATLELDDGSGTWSYRPSGQDGSADARVKALRLRWDAPLPAPTNATFAQDSASDWRAGTSDGTAILPGLDAVGLVGSDAGGTLNGLAYLDAALTSEGTYTSPSLPAADAGRVVAWTRVLVHASGGERGALTIDVLDGDTGAVLVDDATPDVSGAIPLSIDPVVHPTLRLRAELVGGGLRCDLRDVDGPLAPLSTVRPSTFSTNPGFPTICTSRGELFLNIENNEPAYGAPMTDTLVWRPRVAPGTVEHLPHGALTSVRVGFFLDEDTLTGNGVAVGVGAVPLVWHRAPSGWALELLPTGGEATQVTQWDPVRATLFGQPQDGSRLSHWYRDLAGQWQHESLPRPPDVARCDLTGHPYDGLAFGTCEALGVTSPMVWRRGDDDEWDAIPLPYEGGRLPPRPYWVFADGSVLGSRVDRSGNVHWTEGPSGWAWTDLPGTGGATIFDLSVSTASENDSVGGAVGLVEGKVRPALWTRDGDAWSLEVLPLPDDRLDGTVTIRLPGGLYGGTSSVQTPFGQTQRAILWAPHQDGSGWFEVPLGLPEGTSGESIADTSVGDTFLVTYSLANRGVTLEVTATRVGDQVTLATRELGAEDYYYSQPYGGTRAYLARPRYAAQRPACNFHVGNINGMATVWDVTSGTVPLPPVRFDVSAYYETRGQVHREYLGYYLGYSYRRQYPHATIWRPDPVLGLRAFELPPPAPTLNPPDGRAVSADGRFVIGQFLPANESTSRPVAWVWDEAHARYDAHLLEGLGPIGSVSSQYASTGDNPAPLAVFGSSRGPGGDVEGWWLHSPYAPNGWVWADFVMPVGEHFTQPTASQSDFIVGVRSDGGGPTRLTVLVWDEASATGLRRVDLPLPAGATRTFTMRPWNVGYGDRIVAAAEAAPGLRAILYHRTSRFTWEPQDLFAPEVLSAPFAIAAVPHLDTGLPLIHGNGFVPGLEPSDLTIYEPDASGTYHVVRFSPAAGGSSFSALGGSWPTATQYNGGDWGGLRFGMIGGMTFGMGPPRPTLQVPDGNGGWTPVALPMPAGVDYAANVEKVLRGPMILAYGTEPAGNGGTQSVLVGWTFPDGDLRHPVAQRLTLPDGTPLTSGGYPYTGSAPVVDDNGRIVAGPVVRGTTLAGAGALIVYRPGLPIVVTPDTTPIWGAGGDPAITFAYTSPLIVAPQVGPWQRPALWGCQGGAGPTLERWDVSFRTDENPSFAYTITAPARCQDTFVNSAAIATASPEVSESNNASSVTTPLATAELGVVLEVDRAVATTGDTLAWRATVTNHGPGPASDVVASLQLPGPYGLAGEVVSDGWDRLAPGESVALEGDVVVASASSGEVFGASASVTSASLDCDASDDSDATATILGSLPNLWVDVAAPASVRVGEPFQVVITLGNDGNAPSDGPVDLGALLPPGVTVLGYSLPPGVASPPGWTWASVATEASGAAPITIVIDAVVGDCAADGDTLAWSAEVTTATDVDDGDDRDAASTLVRPAAGAIVAALYPSRARVAPGERLTYRVLVHNAGLAAAGAATIRARVPAGTTLVAASLAAGGTFAAGEVSWPLPLTLGPGDSASFTFDADVDGDAVGPLTSEVAVAVDDAGASGTCPSVSVGPAVAVVQTGLFIDKVASRELACGDTVDWRVTVTNRGGAVADGLVVSDVLGGGLTLVPGSLTAGPGAVGSELGAPVLLWTLDALAPGGSVVLGYRTTTSTAPGIASNVARLEQGGQAVALSAAVPVQIDCNAALTIDKALSEGCATLGGDVSVTLAFANRSAKAIGGVVVRDVLAPGLAPSALSPGLAWDATTRVLSADVGVLGPGVAGSVTFTATLEPSLGAGELAWNGASISAASGSGAAPRASNLVHTVARACDDGDGCTADACTTLLGCVHALVPRAEDEVCDGDDNDCDGFVDAADDDLETVRCELQAGVCKGAMKPASLCDDGAWEPCDEDVYGAHSEGAYAASDATCDGVDEDCDGATDQGFVAAATSCGVGACARSGALSCAGAVVSDSCVPGLPARETCNRADDDCDGTTDAADDSLLLDRPCELQAGVCLGAMKTAAHCVGGDWRPCAAADYEARSNGLFAASDATCNALDEDCDGARDEDFAGAPTTCGDGACAGTGTSACVAGAVVTGCQPRADLASCDDGDACSAASACFAGVCRATRAADCDDDDPCTRDRCDAAGGCRHDPLDGVACDDGDACTHADRCVAGACEGAATACAAPDVCQLAGVCNAATGVCEYPPKPGDVPGPIRVVALPGLADGGASEALALRGPWVVGWAAVGGARHAVAWRDDGGSGAAIDLTPDADDARAIGVDGAGRVVGVRVAGGACAVFVAAIDDAGAVTTTTAWPCAGADAASAAGAVVGPSASGHVAGAGLVAGGASAFYADTTTVASVPAVALGDVTVLAVGEGGHVVGAMDVAGASHAFRWTRAGGLADLGPGRAVAVNASGHAAGVIVTASGDEHPASFPVSGAARDLGTLGGPDGAAAAVNDGGLVVGWASDADGAARAFRWQSGALVDLGAPAQGSSDARFVDAAGVVLGVATRASGASAAVVWQAAATGGGDRVDVDPAGGSRVALVGLGHTGADPIAAGDVLIGAAWNAFYWDDARGTVVLGGPGATASTARAVAEDGRVAGAFTVGGAARAFVTRPPAGVCVACELDLTPPELHCPLAWGEAECVAGGVAVDLGRASAHDRCGGAVALSDDAPERFPLGATQVTFTARDDAGNVASCVSTVVVADSVAPRLQCPETIVAPSDPGACGASVTVPLSTFDDCSPTAVSVVCATADVAANQAAFFAPGEHDVSFTAIDEAGNLGTCTTHVVVEPPAGLTIVCDAALSLTAPPDACGYPATLSARVSDVCAPGLEATTRTDLYPIGVTDVVFEADNDRGERASCTTRLTVHDVTPPTIDCHLDPAELPLEPAAILAPSASDACGARLDFASARCVIVDEAGRERPAPGCLLQLGEGGTVVVLAASALDAEGRPIPEGQLQAVVQIVATDPSGNVASGTCAAPIAGTLPGDPDDPDDPEPIAPDGDRDGVVDVADNCVAAFNPDQADFDGDGVGDVCDASSFDALRAEGDGGCAGAGGAAGLGAALVGLAALALGRRGVRRATRAGSGPGAR